jgi:hypothetical protein
MVITERMLRSGKLDAIEHTVRHLHASFPRLAFARNLCELFEHIPAADGQLPFVDDLGKDVQIVRRRRARTAILVFNGFADRLGLPLAVIHRWLGKLPAHLLYLRDFERQFYLRGIRSLGGSRGETLEELNRILGRLKARRVLCVGASGGVFGALHYGVILGADRILCFSGVTNLSPEFRAHAKSIAVRHFSADAVPPETGKPKWSAVVGQHLSMDPELGGLVLNMRQYYEAAKRPPRTLFLFGSENWDDRIQAENLRGLPSVTLREVPNIAEHNIVPDVARRGELGSLLDWLVEPEPAPRNLSFTEMIGQPGKLSELFARMRGNARIGDAQ